ncbi:MAG: hypothetical protein ACREQ9_09780, partial [Candidatus Binatia bacterium]
MPGIDGESHRHARKDDDFIEGDESQLLHVEEVGKSHPPVVNEGLRLRTALGCGLLVPPRRRLIESGREDTPMSEATPSPRGEKPGGRAMVGGLMLFIGAFFGLLTAQ